MRIVNLTDHTLVLIDPDTEKEVRIPSEGKARVTSYNDVQEVVEIGDVRIPIVEIVERTLYHLPEPKSDVLYVVSGLVAATADRPDVVSPARMKRDRTGQVVGARALLRHKRE